jgi:3-oxoacyl-[acyl-carrier protein] reductase
MTRVVIITGARKGIGRYLAEYYLERGMTVAGCSRTESDFIHSDYSHYCLDVSDESAVKKMVRDVYKKYRRIDFLLNNAGIASMNHSIMTPGSTVEKLFYTNFIGTFLFCREAALLMMKAKFGRIVNFTTVAVPLDLSGEAIYASSKAAVEKFTRIFAKELGDYGVTVNAVGPSPVRTDLIKNVPEIKLEELLKQQAISKFGEYADVANIVDFFLNKKSAMITGQTLYLGGVFW